MLYPFLRLLSFLFGLDLTMPRHLYKKNTNASYGYAAYWSLLIFPFKTREAK